MHLLDVNILVALCDPAHEFHGGAHRWFNRARGDGWATCPITENGLVRILGHPNYPGGPGSPARARPLLQALTRVTGHAFWADEVSLADASTFPSLENLSAPALTDLYLLGLAFHYGGTFATFDRRFDVHALPHARHAVVIVPAR